MEILTLLKANIKHKKGAFKSIAVLMMIITMSIISVISVNDNTARNLEKSIKAADVGDFVSFMEDNKFTPKMQSLISNNKNIGRVRDVKCIQAREFNVNGNPIKGISLYFEKWQENYPVFNKNRSGFIDNPETLKPGEIYVPLGLQPLIKCKIGSEIVVTTAHGNEIFKIKGFVEEPFLGSYGIGIKQIFISEDDFDRLSAASLDSGNDANPKFLMYHILHFYKSDSCTLPATEFRNILDECGIIESSYSLISKTDAIFYTTFNTDIGVDILYVFIILLVIIVLIFTGHSISMEIEMDYINLGILKSQGFTKGKIRRVFILQYVIEQLIGVAAGILISIPLTSLLGKAFQSITGILATSEIQILKCSGIITGILILCGAYIFAWTSKIGKISPVRAISGGHEEIYFSSRLNSPVNKTALSVSLALRQFTSNKRQYISTILIAAILVFFMMSINILTNCMNYHAINENMGEVTCDVFVVLNKNLDVEQKDEIEAKIARITPVTLSLYEGGLYFTLDGTQFWCYILDNPGVFKSIQKGRAPLYENEIIITKIVAGEIGKSIGDTVIISYKGAKKEYIISGLFQSTGDLGRCFGMSAKAAQRLCEIKPGAACFKLSDSGKTQEVVDMLNKKFGGILTAENCAKADSGNNVVIFALNVMAVVIYAVSGVFALIVVFMVCSRTFLKEKRDIGIYKAVGFTAFKLRIQFAIRFLIVSVIGSAIGVLLCVLLNEKMLSMLFRTLGVTNFVAKYTLITAVAPVTLICGCFFLFSYVASRRIKSVAVRELVVE